MTKAFLERERAALKSDINLIYNRATAVYRNPLLTDKELIALLRDIESIAMKNLCTENV